MIIETIHPADGRVVGGERHDHVIIAGTVLASTVYATVRYNVFKGVSWSDWPHYVGNKVLAIASLLLIVLAVLRLATPRGRPIRLLMAWASAMAVAHTVISLALLEPAYFEKFYAGERLTLSAGASLVLAAMAFAILQWGKGRPGTSAPVGAVAPLSAIAFLSGVHAALPSIAGWFEPAGWPGHMPPITLISFFAGAIALAASVRVLRQRGQA